MKELPEGRSGTCPTWLFNFFGRRPILLVCSCIASLDLRAAAAVL
jgi:hypothetical protein